jgi:allantoin racemase
MRIHLLNPNTSTTVTERMLLTLRQDLPEGIQIDGHTASFGSPYIADETSYAVANHAVVELLREVQTKVSLDSATDRVLIACFGDPGLFALRELAPCFVTGLAESAFYKAAQLGPFGVVTGGKKWEPMLRRLADALGYRDKLTALHTLEASGQQMVQDPTWAKQMLTQACRQTLAEAPKLSSIVLGGANLVGYARNIQHDVNTVLIDSVKAGLERCSFYQHDST